MSGHAGCRHENGQSWRSYRPMPPSTWSTFTTEDAEPETYQSCVPWIRYAVFACNIIFLVVGVAALAMGIWLRTDSRFRDFLSERYRNAVGEAFWEAPTLYAFSYILIVLGAVMIVVSMFGCCGAATGNKVILVVYAVAVAVLMVATLAAGIYILYKRDGIDVEVADALTYMVQHYYQGPGIIQESLDRLQQAFRCCGNAGCGDFRVFRQDPPRTCDIRCDGCHYRIMLSLRIGFAVAVILFSIVVLAELLTIALSLTMVMRRKDPVEELLYEKERNAAHYSAQRRANYPHSSLTSDFKPDRRDFLRNTDRYPNGVSTYKVRQRY